MQGPAARWTWVQRWSSSIPLAAGGRASLPRRARATGQDAPRRLGQGDGRCQGTGHRGGSPTLWAGPSSPGESRVRRRPDAQAIRRRRDSAHTSPASARIRLSARRGGASRPPRPGWAGGVRPIPGPPARGLGDGHAEHRRRRERDGIRPAIRSVSAESAAGSPRARRARPAPGGSRHASSHSYRSPSSATSARRWSDPQAAHRGARPRGADRRPGGAPRATRGRGDRGAPGLAARGRCSGRPRARVWSSESFVPRPVRAARVRG